MVSALDTESAG